MQRVLKIENIEENFNNLDIIVIESRNEYNEKHNFELNMLTYINSCKHDLYQQLDNIDIEKSIRMRYKLIIENLNKIRFTIWNKNEYVKYHNAIKKPFTISSAFYIYDSNLDFQTFVEDLRFQEEIYYLIMDKSNYLKGKQQYFKFVESIEQKMNVIKYGEYKDELECLKKRVNTNYDIFSKNIQTDTIIDLPEGHNIIFKKHGASVFYELYLKFKDLAYPQASFSYVYIALDEYNLIRSKPSSFIEYLKKCDIYIGKIDTRLSIYKNHRFSVLKNVLKNNNITLKKAQDLKNAKN